MFWLKDAAKVVLFLFGVVVVGMLGMVLVGRVFTHPLFAVLVLLAVGVLGSVGKWRSQEYQLTRPWMWKGTGSMARRYQAQWEQERLAGKLHGGPENHWRE